MRVMAIVNDGFTWNISGKIILLQEYTFLIKDMGSTIGYLVSGTDIKPSVVKHSPNSDSAFENNNINYFLTALSAGYIINMNYDPAAVNISDFLEDASDMILLAGDAVS